MRHPRLLFACLGALLAATMILGAPALEAQLQQSGGPGSSVTILAGSAKIGTVTTDQTTHGVTDLVAADITKVGGTALTLGQQTAANSIPVILPSATITTLTPPTSVGLNAGSNIIGKTAPVTACGTTSFSQAIAAVPTSSTAITTTTTCILAAFVNNTNSTAQTFTLTDNSGTPINIVGPAFSIPGLSNMVIPLGGIQATSGVKWSAGGTGVTGGVIGVQ